MTPVRRRLAIATAVLLALVLVTWSCGTGGDEQASTDGTTSTTEDTGTVDGPPAFVPVTGGTNDDGQPEPPPVHAVFSVVVRGDTSWSPYAGSELTGVDPEETEAIAGRLRRLGDLLRDAGVPASVELAYGPAAALCALEPEVLDELEAAGHRIGIHARSIGEAFRAHDALDDCDRRPTTVSGLAPMADPHGPDGPSRQSIDDAMAVLSVLDLHQVVGQVSPVCVEVGLAEPTHAYGTGAFTAPWRSGWTEGNPCSDLATGRIVMIDQTPLAPGDDAERVDSDALSVLSSRTDQVLGYALDHRFAEPDELPHPGVISWGVTVRLGDLSTPAPSGEGEDGDAEDGDGEEEVEEVLTLLATLIDEQWRPAMEQDRLRWMLPDELALILRPLS
ncbi:MAG: hypothetical protein ACLFRV_09830 [Acidimicrobiales bacterium]